MAGYGRDSKMTSIKKVKHESFDLVPGFRYIALFQQLAVHLLPPSRALGRRSRAQAGRAQAAGGVFNDTREFHVFFERSRATFPGTRAGAEIISLSSTTSRHLPEDRIRGDMAPHSRFLPARPIFVA